MRFEVASELRLFAESARAAVAGWEQAREPELGVWVDDRDDALAARLAAVGWEELWSGDALGAAVAGGLELGRSVAPICLLDEATLGAPLALDGRIRHGLRAEVCAVPLQGWGLGLARAASPREQERTLDGSGTVRATVEDATPLGDADADARWSAWTAATLAYLAGLSAAALDSAVAHARARQQFGRPLSAMPTTQARLAEAALAVDALELTAWQSASNRPLQGGSVFGGHGFATENAACNSLLQSRSAALLWAGGACRDVTASAHQVHGAVGFALETGLHRYYRRAKAMQVWAVAVCRAARSPSRRPPAARGGAP